MANIIFRTHCKVNGIKTFYRAFSFDKEDNLHKKKTALQNRIHFFLFGQKYKLVAKVYFQTPVRVANPGFTPVGLAL